MGVFMSDLIELDRGDGIWRLRIVRPDKANALSFEMLGALVDAFREAASSETIRVLLITGTGKRAFCAGADLSELTTDPDDPKSKIWPEMAQALLDVPAVTVAMINGACIGGGNMLSLCSDVRIAVPDAVFRYPALRNNVFPGEPDRNRLVTLVGPGRASLFLLGGISVPAEEALAWGMVDRLAPPADLEATALANVATALDADRDHLIAMKRFLRAAG